MFWCCFCLFPGISCASLKNFDESFLCLNYASITTFLYIIFTHLNFTFQSAHQCHCQISPVNISSLSHLPSGCTHNSNADRLTLFRRLSLVPPKRGFGYVYVLYSFILRTFSALDDNIAIRVKCSLRPRYCSFSPLRSSGPHKLPGTSRVLPSPVRAQVSTRRVCTEWCMAPTKEKTRKKLKHA